MLEGRTRSPSWHTLYRTKRGPSHSYCQSWEASGLRFYPSRGALGKRTPSCSHPFGELSRPPLFPGPYGHWLVDSREYNDGNDGDSHITVLEYVCFSYKLLSIVTLNVLSTCDCNLCSCLANLTQQRTLEWPLLHIFFFFFPLSNENSVTKE